MWIDGAEFTDNYGFSEGRFIDTKTDWRIIINILENYNGCNTIKTKYKIDVGFSRK